MKQLIKRIIKEESEIPLYILRRINFDDLEDLISDIRDLIDSGEDKTDAIYDSVRQFIASKSFNFNIYSTEQDYWDSYIEVEKPLITYVKKRLGMELQ